MDERHYLIEVLVFVDGLYKTYNKMKRIYAQESAMQGLPWQLKRQFPGKTTIGAGVGWIAGAPFQVRLSHSEERRTVMLWSHSMPWDTLSRRTHELKW